MSENGIFFKTTLGWSASLTYRQAMLAEFYGIKETFPWECVYARNATNHVLAWFFRYF